MELINKLERDLDSKVPFEFRYDLSADDKVHLLYVAPTLNAIGFYRMLAPSIEINKLDTHKALVSSIASDDFSQQFKDDTWEFRDELILWADYIILPPVMNDLSYLIKVFKAINPNVVLIMDIDRNYFALNKLYPKSKKYHIDNLIILENNLSQMNIITTSTKKLSIYLSNLLEDEKQTGIPEVVYLPTAMSEVRMQDLKSLESRKEPTNKVRIGFVKPEELDLLSFKEFVLYLFENLKDSVEWVYYGNAITLEEVKELLQKIGCEIHKVQPFENSLTKLNDLQLDMVLLPAQENLYNKLKGSTTYLEIAALGIPVIASVFHPAKEYIIEAVTGLLIHNQDKWKTKTEALLKDSEMRNKLRGNLLSNNYKINGFNDKYFKRFYDLFV